MKTFTRRKEVHIITEVESVTCNKCGNSIGIGYDCDYLSVQKGWGYGSRKDMSNHAWDLCEPCYDAFVASFKVPFTYVDHYGEPLEETVYDEVNRLLDAGNDRKAADSWWHTPSESIQNRRPIDLIDTEDEGLLIPLAKALSEPVG